MTSESLIPFRDVLEHRGPDDAGIWRNRNGTVVLGHRRLSIIDLSHGSHQPFVSSDERYVIVFNGEIYNYPEIRSELENRGRRFRSTGDTEVVLVAYEEWGHSCIEKFNGMFAFAIYDHGNAHSPEQLFLARDRVGKKPFYYRYKVGEFEFASELKAIDTSGNVDLQALNHYLALGYIPFDLCITEGVKKLLPGHAGVYEYRNGSFRTWRYWKLPQTTPDVSISGDRLASESWDLLRESVRLRLRSDAPVGVFLSGGLDSSLIAAAASEVSTGTVKTFTIAVPHSPLNESSHARLVAEYFGTEHNVLELSEGSLDVLDELAPYVDEPLADSSILPTFLISRLTSGHVKVALGGDGGDELYGGYRHYQQHLRDQHRLGWAPGWVLGYTARLATMLPAGIRGRNRLASFRNGTADAFAWGTPFFDVDLRKRILSPAVVEALGKDLDLPERNLLRLMRCGVDEVDSITRTDFMSVLPDDYLVKVDRASMANSLEVRSPFLDYHVVEHAFGSIPSSWKVNRIERRRVQNLMATKYLPARFDRNRKQGFSVPLDAWLRRDDMRKRIENLPAFINRTEVEKLLKGQSAGRANGSRLFALMMLSISHRNLQRGSG